MTTMLNKHPSKNTSAITIEGYDTIRCELFIVR